MYSIIISLCFAVLIGFVTSRDLGPVWGVVCGFGAALLSQLVIALLLRKKINAVNEKLQEIMQNAQYKINRQMQMFQQRPGGNIKFARQTLEKMQNDAVKQTLEGTALFDPYYRWNPMLKKQISAMKMQLYFQIRDFEKVDELLKKALLVDQRSLLIKLVRMYKKDDPALDKFYQRKLARFKGDEGAFAACTYAWMKLKKGEDAKALAALVEAMKSSDHQVLMENHDRLVNGKQKHFSNSGFGDLWYTLYLEEPKIKVQQQRPRF